MPTLVTLTYNLHLTSISEEAENDKLGVRGTIFSGNETARRI